MPSGRPRRQPRSGCGAELHGLSRLRATQEGVRERARWALSQGEPSSGVPPWKCAKAHFQKGYHQSLLKPAPSARRPLAEAAAVFQSWVPQSSLPGLSPAFSPAGSVSAERCPLGTSAVRPVRCFFSTGCAGFRSRLFEKRRPKNFYSASRFSSSSSVLRALHSSNSRSPSWCNWAISSLNWVTRS